MKPTTEKTKPVPWWWVPGAKHPYDGLPPIIRRPVAVSEHPHWAEPRTPGRKVLRQQARRRGELRPRRVHRSKRRTGPIGRIFNSGAMPLIPSFLQNFPTLGRKTGGDR